MARRHQSAAPRLGSHPGQLAACHADTSDFVVAPLAKARAVEARVFVYHTRGDGLISSIHVARAGELKRVS